MNFYTAIHHLVNYHGIDILPHTYHEGDCAYETVDESGVAEPSTVEEVLGVYFVAGGNGLPEFIESLEQLIDFAGDLDEKVWQVVDGILYMLPTSLARFVRSFPIPQPDETPPLVAFSNPSFGYKGDLSRIEGILGDSEFFQQSLAWCLVGSNCPTFEQGFFQDSSRGKNSRRKGLYSDFLKELSRINLSLKGFGSNLRLMAKVDLMKDFGITIGGGLAFGTRPHVKPSFLYFRDEDVDEEYCQCIARNEEFLTDLEPNEATKMLLQGIIPPPAVLSSVAISDTVAVVQRRISSTVYRDFGPIFAEIRVKPDEARTFILSSGWSCRYAHRRFEWMSPKEIIGEVLDPEEYEKSNRLYPLDGSFNVGSKVLRIGGSILERKPTYLSVHNGKLHISSKDQPTYDGAITEQIAKRVLDNIIIDNVILVHPQDSKFRDKCLAVMHQKEAQKAKVKVMKLQREMTDSSVSSADKTKIRAQLITLQEDEKKKENSPTADAVPLDPGPSLAKKYDGADYFSFE